MVINVVGTAYLDGFNGTYPCYVNKAYCLHGYAPWFTKETSIEILKEVKKTYDKDNYKVKWRYDKKKDCFIYEDLENGCGKEYYYGEDILTEDGLKHLYGIGEWNWDLVDE